MQLVLNSPIVHHSALPTLHPVRLLCDQHSRLICDSHSTDWLAVVGVMKTVMCSFLQTPMLSPSVHILLCHNKPDTWHFRNLIHKSCCYWVIIETYGEEPHASEDRHVSCAESVLFWGKKSLNSKIDQIITWLSHFQVLIDQMFYSKWLAGDLLAHLWSRLGALWGPHPLCFQSHVCPIGQWSLTEWTFVKLKLHCIKLLRFNFTFWVENWSRCVILFTTLLE